MRRPSPRQHRKISGSCASVAVNEISTCAKGLACVGLSFDFDHCLGHMKRKRSCAEPPRHWVNLSSGLASSASTFAIRLATPNRSGSRA